MSLVRSPPVALALLFASLLSPVGAAAVQADPPMVPPLPPMNVAWTETDGEVVVTWDPPLFFGGAESVTYRVYKDTLLVADGLTSTTYIEDVPSGEGASASASATYSVTAVNDAGESARGSHMGPCIQLEPFSLDVPTCAGIVIGVVFWVLDQIIF